MKASLAFFNELSAKLSVELSNQPERIRAALTNEGAESSAVIVSLRLHASVFENRVFRELTEEELEVVVLEEPEIALRGLADVVTHPAPGGVHFTVRSLLDAIEVTERQTRARSKWFGGIDVHHVFFEGLDRGDDGVWQIIWAS